MKNIKSFVLIIGIPLICLPLVANAECPPESATSVAPEVIMEEDENTISSTTPKSLEDELKNNPDLSILSEILEETNLFVELENLDEYTLFAPTNAAFEEVPDTLITALKNNPDKLKQILLYHTLETKLNSTDLISQSYDTLESSEVTIDVMQDGVLVNTMSNVITPDINTEKGVIHTIDEVLVPQDFGFM